MATLEPGATYETEAGDRFVTCALADDVDSPRSDECNLGTMLIWSRRHTSPDPAPKNVATLAEQFGLTCKDHPKEFCRAFEEANLGIAVPLWVYDHSATVRRLGQENPFHDPWDSGLAGLAYATWKHASELWCCPVTGTDDDRTRARQELDDEMREYDDWAEGRTFHLTVYDTDANVCETMTVIGDETEKNGADDTFGTLEESAYADLDEWMEARLESA